jgi:hypothetical protein
MIKNDAILGIDVKNDAILEIDTKKRCNMGGNLFFA